MLAILFFGALAAFFTWGAVALYDQGYIRGGRFGAFCAGLFLLAALVSAA